MSIILNKDIYDEGQGNPFDSIIKYIELLDSKINDLKTTAKGLEKSLLDVNKTSDGGEAKLLIEQTNQLNTATEKLITTEKSKLQIETNLKTITDTYSKAVNDSTIALNNSNKSYESAIIKMTNLKSDVNNLTKALDIAKKNISSTADSTDVWAKEVSNLTVKLEIQKKELKDATLLAKNLETVNRSETETIQSLKAQLSAATIAWNKLTVAQIQNSDEGKKLQSDMKSISETLRVLEMERGVSGRNVGKYAQSLKGMKLELRELKGVLLNSTQGTDEYNKALQRSAYLTDEMGDMQARVKGTAMDFEGVMGNVSKVTQGAASMFEIAQGAEALFGIESEDLAKTLVKVQAAMAIANGLQGLDGMGKAFKNLLTQIKIFGQGVNKALLATGIGAFVLALTAITFFWDDIKAAISGVTEEQKKLNETLRSDVESQEYKLSLIENQDDILKLQGRSEEFILKRKMEQLSLLIEDQKQIVANNAEMRDGQIKAEEKNKSIIKGIFQFIQFPIYMLNETLKQVSGALSTITGKKVDWTIDLKLDDKLASLFFDPEEKKKELDDLAKADEAKLNELNNKQAKYMLASVDMQKQKTENDSKLWDKEIKKAEDATQLKLDLFKKASEYEQAARIQNRQSTQTQYEIDRQQIIDKYAEELSVARQAGVDLVEIRKARDAELNKLDAKRNGEKDAFIQGEEMHICNHRKNLQRNKIKDSRKILSVKKR
jgi:hypothetical protein